MTRVRMDTASAKSEGADAQRKVIELELRMEHARNPQDHQAPPPAPRPRRDPEVAARVREWNRRRRIERARATVTRLAPEFETPEPPLDHGELSVPGRAGATITDAAPTRPPTSMPVMEPKVGAMPLARMTPASHTRTKAVAGELLMIRSLHDMPRLIGAPPWTALWR